MTRSRISRCRTPGPGTQTTEQSSQARTEFPASADVMGIGQSPRVGDDSQERPHRLPRYTHARLPVESPLQPASRRIMKGTGLVGWAPGKPCHHESRHLQNEPLPAQDVRPSSTSGDQDAPVATHQSTFDEVSPTT
jgi:hypothetical protein